MAVIDTGIYYNHTDLAANMWVNPGEAAGNALDDDGNGYTNDLHGYDIYNDDGDPLDDYTGPPPGHGTRCAGHIGAVGDNLFGVAGVCWRVGLMGVKMWSDTGDASISGAIESVNYVTMMRTNGINVRVINTSWGVETYNQELEDAFAAAGKAGILCIASAGNAVDSNPPDNIDVTPQYPAAFDLSNIIAVAATTQGDELSPSSNWGTTSVDLGAPGVGILSTALNDQYLSSDGTSRSAPMVAGAAALLWSVRPEATVADVRRAILDGTDPLASLAGKTVTGGRLNLFGACKNSAFPMTLTAT